MKRSLINRCVAIAVGVLCLLLLIAFGGVNLHNVRSVRLTFNEHAQGEVLITDVAFASAPR